MDDYKTRSDNKKNLLQSQSDKSFNKQNSYQRLLLKPAPTLQFQQQSYQIKKDSVGQKAIKRSFFDGNKENTHGFIQKAIMQYPFYTDNLIDYYKQISQPLI